MHLTNYAINKGNPKFIFNNDSDKDDIGHKRSLSWFFKVISIVKFRLIVIQYIKEQGHNTD